MNSQSLKDNPRVLTLSAIILGYALIGDYSANEQNSIGNWFMLIGQILETNAAFEQMKQANQNTQSSSYTSLFDHRLSVNEAEIQKIKEVLENLLNKINHL